MGRHREEILIPERLPSAKWLTERELAVILNVTAETLRAWRRRGEMPPVAQGAEAAAFAKSQHARGRLPTVYRVREVRAWLEAFKPPPRRSAKPELSQNARPQPVSSAPPPPPPPPALPQPRHGEPPERPRDVLGRPLSIVSLLYEELNRMARELGPIPGF